METVSLSLQRDLRSISLPVILAWRILLLFPEEPPREAFRSIERADVDSWYDEWQRCQTNIQAAIDPVLFS